MMKCIFVFTFNMQVLVMGLLAYLTSVLVLQLATCQWDLVVRYCCIEVGIKGCIVLIDNVEIISLLL
jgi:hypothetical protein